MLAASKRRKNTPLEIARAAIEEHGVLLVYPVSNRPEPLSLWHVLYPGHPMRWAWDASADDRVVALWQLREELAGRDDLVYTKWLSGRATFFSRALFAAMLAKLHAAGDLRADLSRESVVLLELLLDDSPQATRHLREGADLGGRVHESAFVRGMRALWERLLVVGMGETEEGGFPSLSVGATALLYEDIWNRAAAGDVDPAPLARALETAPVFARAWRRVTKRLEAAQR